MNNKIPKVNRINFGEALRPFEGYELDYAVGTSYTLDLETLIFLPLSLFYGEDLEIEKHCSNELLAALTKVPEKVRLFCQRGKIVSPLFYHNILECWSENVEQIQMDNYNESFHPKIWLLRYVPVHKRHPIRYRFICTSRNISKSTDWDLAIVTEGCVTKKTYKGNEPLGQFMRFLNSKARKKIPQELLAEIPHIAFELEPGQESLEFFPMIPSTQHPLFNKNLKAKEMLVITPFLDSDSIRRIREQTKRLVLLSTKAELDKLPLKVLQQVDDCYQFNPLLELDPPLPDEKNIYKDSSVIYFEPEQEFVQGNELHAKLYVIKEKNQVSWFIGSANCTSPACTGRNIEFLTALSAPPKILSDPRQLLEILTNIDKNQQGLFIPYERASDEPLVEDDSREKDLRRLIFDLSRLNIRGIVTETEKKLYDYHIKISPAQIHQVKNWKIYMQPLSGMMGKPEEITKTTLPRNYSFMGYELHRLTPYFLFTIKEEDLILKTLVIKLEMSFPEDRMKKIFTSLIGDREKLMKYLSFLLTRDQVENLFELTDQPGESSSVRQPSGWNSEFPIYEKLLVATSRHPQALRQTIDMVELLKDEVDINNKPVVEPGFRELIKIFKNTLDYHD